MLNLSPVRSEPSRWEVLTLLLYLSCPRWDRAAPWTVDSFSFGEKYDWVEHSPINRPWGARTFLTGRRPVSSPP